MLWLDAGFGHAPDRALYDVDDVGDAVVPTQRPRVLRRTRGLYSVDLPRAGMCSPHCQDAGPSAHVEHDLIAKARSILCDGVKVRVHARSVDEHLHLMAQRGVVAKVLSEVRRVFIRATLPLASLRPDPLSCSLNST